MFRSALALALLAGLLVAAPPAMAEDLRGGGKALGTTDPGSVTVAPARRAAPDPRGKIRKSAPTIDSRTEYRRRKAKELKRRKAVSGDGQAAAPKRIRALEQRLSDIDRRMRSLEAKRRQTEQQLRQIRGAG